MRKLLLTLILAVGCTTPHDYVDTETPEAVTLPELAAHADKVEQHYQTYCQVEGVMFQAKRSAPDKEKPDRYGSGGDSAIFGGHKVAADVFRYRTLPSLANLQRVEQSLRGIYILTHITGTPGVIARCAFPADRKIEWHYPWNWQHRIDKGFVHNSPTDVADPFHGGTFPEMIYYTRATKDQLTGILLGLAVTWKYLVVDEDSHTPNEVEIITRCRRAVADTAHDLYSHLKDHDFKIRDEKGENDTNADSVSGAMLTTLLAVYKETVGLTHGPERALRIQEKFDDQITWTFPELGDLFHIFTNYFQYFAWNLRYLTSYTVYLMADKDSTRDKIRNWCDGYMWPYLKGHKNSWFIYLNNAVDPSKGNLDDAGYALRSMSLRPTRGINSPLAGDERKPSLLQVLLMDTDRFVIPPHLRKVTSYSLWQKEPWDSGKGTPLAETLEDPIALDFITAYWMGRFYGFLR